MSLDNFKVQELNTVEMNIVKGGRNVQIGQCVGGAFSEPFQRIGEIAWWGDGWNR
jgi:hypothetical protein